MLSFTSSLSPDCEAFAIFVTDKYRYKDKKHVLSNSLAEKISSFLEGTGTEGGAKINTKTMLRSRFFKIRVGVF